MAPPSGSKAPVTPANAGADVAARAHPLPRAKRPSPSWRTDSDTPSMRQSALLLAVERWERRILPRQISLIATPLVERSLGGLHR